MSPILTYGVRCEDCGWTFESASWEDVVQAGEDHRHDDEGDGGVREPRRPITPQPIGSVRLPYHVDV